MTGFISDATGETHRACGGRAANINKSFPIGIHASDGTIQISGSASDERFGTGSRYPIVWENGEPAMLPVLPGHEDEAGLAVESVIQGGSRFTFGTLGGGVGVPV